MKKIVIALMAASGLLVAAPLPAFAGIDVAAVCDGAVPEGWTRPGGFCDQNDFNRSLSDPASSPGCEIVRYSMVGNSDRLRVAIPASTCCESDVNFQFAPSDTGVLLADYDPCYHK